MTSTERFGVGDLGEINTQRLLSQTLADQMNCWYVDLGVRNGYTSRVLLEGSEARDNDVTGVDASPTCPPDLAIHPHYAYWQYDSVSWLSNLFTPFKIRGAVVDTLHVREQVMCELYYLWPLIEIGGWVAFHDTAWPDGKHDHYLGRDWQTPDRAIADFFGVSFPRNLQFSTEAEQFSLSHHPDSWGLTIVTKRTNHDFRQGIDWNPIFAARNDLLSLLDGHDVLREKITIQ
jgi:hypothetical protein